jgi:hypothetical protein
MAAGATYTPIATATVSGTSTNLVSFTSIPSTYTDLVCIVNSSKTAGSIVNIYIRYNNDSGYNYSCTFMYGDGTSGLSGRQTTSNQIANMVGDQGTDLSTTIINTMNYANTTTYKTTLSRYNSNQTGDVVMAGVGLWQSTAAINRADILLSASNYFSAGSTMTLYGIAAA